MDTEEGELDLEGVGMDLYRCGPCSLLGHTRCDGTYTSHTGQPCICMCSDQHTEASRAGASPTFDPTAIRAVKGLEFQDVIRLELEAILGPPAKVTDVRSWLRDELKISDESLNISEKIHGDVTFLYRNTRYFVECCLALNPKFTRIGESKREKFVGPDKFYCIGISKDDGSLERICYIPSLLFRKYLGKCKLNEVDGYKSREIPCHLVGPNIRVSAQNSDDFLNKLIR